MDDDNTKTSTSATELNGHAQSKPMAIPGRHDQNETMWESDIALEKTSPKPKSSGSSGHLNGRNRSHYSESAGSEHASSHSRPSLLDRLHSVLSRTDSVHSHIDTTHNSEMGSHSNIGSTRRIHMVTESASWIPSLASTFSLEQAPPSLPQNLHGYTIQGVGDEFEISASYQGNLHYTGTDAFEDPNYTDTVQSNDSASSLLRRTLSVPGDYRYKDKEKITHVKDIFNQLSTENTSSSNKINDKQWRQTMEDLLEQPEYLDSLTSTSSKTGLLAKQALSIARDAKSKLPPFKEEEIVNPKKNIKNLLIEAAAFLCVFTSYLSIRNLQSSLNDKGGLGLISLSTVYAFLMIGCIFATSIVQRLRPKYTMIACFLGMLIYCMSNFYPSYYTLIPGSAIAGLSLANVWTAQATYTGSISAAYADITGQTVTDVLSKFNGIFYTIFQFSQIIGGTLSSIILLQQKNRNKDNLDIEIDLNFSHPESIYFNNGTMDIEYKDYSNCGLYYCHTNKPGSSEKLIDDNILYMLVGIFMAFIIAGVVIIGVFLDPLEGELKKAHSSLTKQLTAVFRWYADIRVVSLLGLMGYSLLQVGFLFVGEFTKAYVTCSSGIYMVGFVAICMSAFCSISSLIVGKIQRYTGRMVLFLIAGGLHGVLYMVMFLWRPTPDTFYVLFVIAALWGMADGVFLTQTISLIGLLFSDNKEPAFAGLKMTQSFTACTMFVISPYLCTWMKLIIMVFLLIWAMVGYVYIEIRLTKQEKVIKEKRIPSTDDFDNIKRKIGPTPV